MAEICGTVRRDYVIGIAVESGVIWYTGMCSAWYYSGLPIGLLRLVIFDPVCFYRQKILHVHRKKLFAR